MHLAVSVHLPKGNNIIAHIGERRRSLAIMGRYRRNQFKFEKAREMRSNPTRAEARMYEILYSEVVRKYPEHIFYRQSVQFGYILDFYCPTLRLGIEVDGAVHYDRETYDKNRDSVLGQRNIQVFRFGNNDVLYNPQGVADRLCQIVQEKNNHRGFIAAPAYRTTAGQIVQEKTNRNSNCFIATAAYGTTTAEELDVLREFRDVKLESNLVGRKITDLYYFVSPPIANIIARSEKLRAFVRKCLNPIINILKRKGYYSRALIWQRIEPHRVFRSAKSLCVVGWNVQGVGCRRET